MEFNRRTKQGKPTSGIGFAAMIFGMAFLSQVFYAYNLSYYTNLGLIDLAGASACKIVFTVVDWLDDLLFGALSERTHSKWGKRIPWLLGVFIWMPVFVVLTFIVGPSTPFSTKGFITYYLLISVGQEFASTIFYTNYYALFPTLFHTTDARNKTASMKHFFELIAVGLCFVLTPILADDFNIPYYAIALMYSIVYVVFYAIGLRSMNINDDIKSINENTNKYSFRQTLKDCLKDAPFVVYNLANSCFSSALSVAVSLFPHYCMYVLGISGWQQSITIGGLFLTVLLSIPLWYWLNRKIGFIKTWLISFTCAPFALALLLIPNDFISGLIISCCIGPFFGGLLLSPDMIGAEIVDIDKIKHHISREAAIGSVSSLVGRIMIIVSTVLATYLPSRLGYNSGIDTGPNPSWAFKATLGIMIPSIMLLGAILAYVYVKISRKERMALHELKRADCENTTELDIREVINETRK